MRRGQDVFQGGKILKKSSVLTTFVQENARFFLVSSLFLCEGKTGDQTILGEMSPVQCAPHSVVTANSV